MSNDEYFEDNAQTEPEQPVGDPYSSLEGLGYDEHETAATRQALQGIIDHHVQQAVEPVQRDLQHVTSQLDAQEHEEQLLDLEERYPELQRDEVAERVLVQAREIAQERGDPSLATDPEFLELVYLRSGAGRSQSGRGQTGPSQAGRGGEPDPFDTSPETREINDAIIGAQSGVRNVWGW